MRVDADLLLARPERSPLCDVALVGHELKHLVALLPGELRVAGRRVLGGELGQRGQQGRLLKVELGDVLVEVRESGGLHAVGPRAVVHRVEVLGEDLVFGPAVLELPGEHRLAELARVGAFVADVGVLHELLGDRGAALDDAAGAEVLDQGAGHALEVDAVVRVEALVLHGHGGLLHDVRDLVAGHEDAVLGAVQLGDHLAVAVVDRGVDGVGPLAQLLQRGQVAREREDGAGGHAEPDDHEQQDDDAGDLQPEELAPLSGGGLLPACAAGPRHVVGAAAVSSVVRHGSSFYPIDDARTSACVHAGARLRSSSEWSPASSPPAPASLFGCTQRAMGMEIS